MKPSIKAITVKNLINVLLALAVLLLLITGVNFRYLSQRAVENQALAIAELVKAGLTAHMKAGIMDKRDYYLAEIRELHRVNRLQVIRSSAVSDQFGPGKALEEVADPITRRVFDTHQAVFILNEFVADPTIRAVIPYVAARQGGLNCLACHQVREGSVLGAVDVELDVSTYRNQSLLVLAGLLVLALVFLLIILVNTSRTIQRYVQAPLESLIENAMEAYQRHRPVSPDQFVTEEFTHVAQEFNLFNSEIIAHQDLLQEKNRELLALNDEIESTLRETVYTMGVIEEQRSRETHNHTRRVTLYSQLLAQRLGLPDRDVGLITAAAPLHDIGKLGIPDEILFKPGKFTIEERKIMQNHTRIGYSMLSHSGRDILKAAAIIALQHHEQWDGSGYPQGLRGEGVHIYGRIVAVADVFDALLFSRVYKRAWGLDEVLTWIREQRGRHFDPALVDLFLAHSEDFVAIAERYPAE